MPGRKRTLELQFIVHCSTQFSVQRRAGIVVVAGAMKTGDARSGGSVSHGMYDASPSMSAPGPLAFSVCVGPVALPHQFPITFAVFTPMPNTLNPTVPEAISWTLDHSIVSVPRESR